MIELLTGRYIYIILLLAMYWYILWIPDITERVQVSDPHFYWCRNELDSGYTYTPTVSMFPPITQVYDWATNWALYLHHYIAMHWYIFRLPEPEDRVQVSDRQFGWWGNELDSGYAHTPTLNASVPYLKIQNVQKKTTSTAKIDAIVRTKHDS